MRVLVIGDTHCPVMLPGYPAFLTKTKRKYKCDKVVHIGDLVDWASISYHPKAPSLKNSELEFEKAKKQVRELYKRFPEADWMIGNHDSLAERHANDIGLPLSVLKDYADLWDVPGWATHARYEALEIDGCLYQHGDRGRGGQLNAAFLNAQDEHCSVIQGHFHAQGCVNYLANERNRIFGLQVGCGIDHKHAAMEYGVKFNKKPLIGCGVVIDGEVGIFEPMSL